MSVQKSNSDLIVKLNVLNRSLHFSADELMKISLKATCTGTGSSGITSFLWKVYQEDDSKPENMIVEHSSKQGTVTLGIHNMYAGYDFVVIVEAKGTSPDSITPLNSSIELTSISEEPSGEAISVLTKQIIRPTCKRKVRSVEWCDRNGDAFCRQENGGGPFPLLGKNYDVVDTVVQLTGFNNQQMFAFTEVWEDDTMIWNRRTDSIVEDGVVCFRFVRRLLAELLNENEEKELTFVCRLQPSLTDTSIIGEYKCKFTVSAKSTVEKIDSFPIQPVFVGNRQMIESNHSPCKYTAITVQQLGKEASEPVTVYDGFTHLPFNIIAKEEVTKVKIKAEQYTVGKKAGRCVNLAEHIPGNGEWTRELTHDVPLINCIWPLGESAIKRYTHTVKSCRHTENVRINLLPDVKWSVSFSFSMGEKTQKGLSKELELKLGYESRGSGQEATLTYKGVTGSDSLKQYLKETLLQNFETYINLLDKTSEFLNNFREIFGMAQEELKDKYKGRYKELPTTRKVLTFEWVLPSFEIGCEWEPAVSGSAYGILATGKAKGTLIGVEIVLDLLAGASKLSPAARLFVASMDLMAYVFNAEVRLDIKIEGDVSIQGSFTYNGAENLKSGSVEAVGEIKASLIGEFTIKASENKKIQTADGEVTTASKGSYGVEGSGGLEITMGVEPEYRGYIGILNGKFTGLEVVCCVTSEVEYAGTGSKKKPKTGEAKGGRKWILIPEKPLFDEKRFYLIGG